MIGLSKQACSSPTRYTRKNVVNYDAQTWSSVLCISQNANKMTNGQQGKKAYGLNRAILVLANNPDSWKIWLPRWQRSCCFFLYVVQDNPQREWPTATENAAQRPYFLPWELGIVVATYMLHGLVLDIPFLCSIARRGHQLQRDRYVKMRGECARRKLWISEPWYLARWPCRHSLNNIFLRVSPDLSAAIS